MGKSRNAESITMDERWQVTRVAWGWCGLKRTEHGMTRVSLPVATRAEAEAAVDAHGGTAADDALLREVAGLLAAHFAGRPVRFEVTLDLRGMGEFGRSVLAACARIPWGRTATYGELALAVGRPGAARAVGQALGRNPLPVVIPCHRVIGADGRLVGFGSGVAMKRRLLEHEGVDLTAS